MPGGLTRYILSRVGATIPTLVLVTFAVFMILRLVPGDPVQLMFGTLAPPSPSEMASIRHELGLDRPLLVQYAIYMDHVLHGDLGQSYRSQQPVAEMIAERLPRTLRLMAMGLVVSTVIGLLAGVLAGVNQGRWLDVTTMIGAVAGVSVPQFWLGVLLIMIFAVRLHWLPVAGSTTFAHTILPALTLGLTGAAVLARVTRSGMVEILREDFIRTARAKGVPPRRVAYVHALKNVLIPCLTVVGLQVGSLLSGAFVVENVFGYAGIGQLAVYALNTRDFPVIQGVVLLAAVGYVMVNLVVDVLYAFVDPRIRY